MFRVYRTHDGQQTLFRQVDRIRLLRSMCNSLVRFHKCASYGFLMPFVPHHKEYMKIMCDSWLSMDLMLDQPLWDIREYFGE